MNNKGSVTIGITILSSILILSMLYLAFEKMNQPLIIVPTGGDTTSTTYISTTSVSQTTTSVTATTTSTPPTTTITSVTTWTCCKCRFTTECYLGRCPSGCLTNIFVSYLNQMACMRACMTTTTSIPTPPPTTTSIGTTTTIHTCTDTDASQPDQYRVKGTCTSQDWSMYADTCLGDDKLHEYKCVNPISCGSEDKSCSATYGANYKCVDGACVATCYDPDYNNNGVQQYQVQTLCLDSAGSHGDYCTGSQGMNEYHCMNNNLCGIVQTDCNLIFGSSYGCYQGACVIIQS